jgi:hypothetical protein
MADTLVDVYAQMSARDGEILEKQAMQKVAAQEADAAGRIMARGFADELGSLVKMAEGLAPLGSGGYSTAPAAAGPRPS